MEENPNSNQSDEKKTSNEESECCLEDYFLNQTCYFCLNKIDPEFYNDLFNLFGICRSTEEMKRNLRYIFQKRDYISDSNDEEEQQLIERKAISVYIQIHQRYIMSDTGIRKIYKRYMNGEFGKCPCYRCKWTPLLPVGLSDRPNVDSIKLLCPNCNGLYNVEYPYNMVDGAFFGESFGGFFFLNFSIQPSSLPKYEPSIFGFKIHSSSPYYQQSKPIEDEKLFVCFNHIIKFVVLSFMDSENQYNLLYEQMKELLSEKYPDHDEVKTVAGKILALHRSFPADLRFRIWEVLLDVAEREMPDFNFIVNTQCEPNENSVIIQDVNRSFNNIEDPRRSELQHQLLILITTYCAKYDVAYWQGMHDIIATMLLFEPQPPLDRIFILFSTFLQTFIPNPVKDPECILLMHNFEMIRLLLQYHDPQLSQYLIENNALPHVYSMSMLLTLHAHEVCTNLLLSIWDQYIFYKNPTIHVFSLVYHLIANKERILAYPAGEILNFITHLPYDNDELDGLHQKHNSYSSLEKLDESDQLLHSLYEELKQRKCDPTIITDLVPGAIRLMQNTPPGFIHRINNILNDKATISQQTLESYCDAPCVFSSPAEIATYLVRGFEKNVNCLHYLLLDSRPYAIYKKSHLTNSKNVTTNTLINLEKMDILVRKARDHSSHIVILTDTVDNELCKQLVEILIKRGCRYVSQVIGGYDRIIKLLKQDESINYKDLITVDSDVKGDEEIWEKPKKEKPIEKKEMVKNSNGKQCLHYVDWLKNPQVKSYNCKKVQKVLRDGKEVFMSTNEKKMVLTSGFMFIIDIESCKEEEYAIIDAKYNYEMIESVKEAGKDYIFMVIAPNKEGQKKKLLFNITDRDSCLSDIRSKLG